MFLAKGHEKGWQKGKPKRSSRDPRLVVSCCFPGLYLDDFPMFFSKGGAFQRVPGIPGCASHISHGKKCGW